MAQLGAQRVRTAKVAGSTPAESTCGVQLNWLAPGSDNRKEVIDVAVLLLNVNGAPARVTLAQHASAGRRAPGLVLAGARQGRHRARAPHPAAVSGRSPTS